MAKKGAASTSKMYKYFSLCQERESFRVKLVDMIKKKIEKDNVLLKLKECVREAGKVDSDPFATSDNDILYYYYYLTHGIDDDYIGSMDANLLEAILTRVASKWRKKYKERLKVLMKEVKEEYVQNVKKSVVEFVIGSSLYSSLREFVAYEENEGSAGIQLPKENAVEYQLRKAKIEKKLLLYRPIVRRIVDYWYREFSDTKIVDEKQLAAAETSYDLSAFERVISKMCQKVKDDLAKNWSPKIEAVLIAALKKNELPTTSSGRRQLFNCINFIMEEQLRKLCMQSINEYVDYIFNKNHTLRGFEIKVVARNSMMTFEPGFNVFEEVFLKMLNSLREAVATVPRIETLINIDSFNMERKLLEPHISQKCLLRHTEEIVQLIEREKVLPTSELKEFEKYANFISDSENEKIQGMLKNDSSQNFETFRNLVAYYDRLSRNIKVEFHRTSFAGFFVVYRGELMEYISSAARKLKEDLVGKMISDYQQKSRAVGNEYQSIVDRALTVPANTMELVELRKFIHETETETVKELQRRLKEIIKYIVTLSDYSILRPVEMKLNNFAFQWYFNLSDMFKKHRETAASKMGEFQTTLKRRIDRFERDLETYAKYCDELQYWGNISELERYKKKADRLENKLIHAMDMIDKFNVEEELFGWEMSQYPLRKATADKLAPYKKLYDAACDFLSNYDSWMNTMIGVPDPENIETKTATAYRTVYRLERAIQEPITRKLAEIIRIKIETFKDNIPLITTLGNPSMKDRHWEQISEIVGFPIKVDEAMTLARILDYGLGDYVSKFEGISEAASKEGSLEKALQRMHLDWADIAFTVNAYRDTGTYIIASIDEIQLLLDDHVIKAQTMKNSLYIKPFEKETLEWEAKLHLLQNILDYWLLVQATWMYLEPIFSSPDIQQQMPEEGRRFSAVDKVWREIMSLVAEDPRVMSVVEIDKMLERLQKCTNLLDLVQKGLTAYLEKKRLYFARFFFLSNDELLEILSETKDPTRVQPHLKKCFEGIARVGFTEDLEIISMKSSEGEEITLENIIDTKEARGQVEKWLLELEISMKKSVRTQVVRSKDAYLKQIRSKWALEWPGQTILCVSKLYWTADVTDALSKSVQHVGQYVETCTNELNEIVKLDTFQPVTNYAADILAKGRDDTRANRLNG